MTKSTLIVSMITIALSVVVIGNFWSSQEQPISTSQNTETYPKNLSPQDITTLTSQQSTPAPERYLMAAQQLPASLQGLPTPQNLDIDSAGKLIINRKILSLFEFYFSGLGEETLAVVTKRINDFMIKTLTSPALEQAQAILKNYLSYLNHLTMFKSEYEQASSSLTTLSLAKAEISTIKEQYFTDEIINAFWGKHTQYEEFMLAIAAIEQDKSTTQSEKDLAINNLKQLTPNWLITQQDNANQLNRYRVEHQLLTDNNADENELYDLAANQFGEEAATRLADLRQHRQEWQQRIAQYRIEYDQLITSDLAVLALKEQLTQLRQSHFNEQERKRITALDNSYKLNQKR